MTLFLERSGAALHLFAHAASLQVLKEDFRWSKVSRFASP
jgi:hypothetical protein